MFDAHIRETDEQLDIAGLLLKAGINTEQFSDEFYLSRMTSPSAMQKIVYDGLTTGRGQDEK